MTNIFVISSLCDKATRKKVKHMNAPKIMKGRIRIYSAKYNVALVIFEREGCCVLLYLLRSSPRGFFFEINLYNFQTKIEYATMINTRMRKLIKL